MDTPSEILAPGWIEARLGDAVDQGFPEGWLPLAVVGAWAAALYRWRHDRQPPSPDVPLSAGYKPHLVCGRSVVGAALMSGELVAAGVTVDKGTFVAAKPRVWLAARGYKDPRRVAYSPEVGSYRVGREPPPHEQGPQWKGALESGGRGFDHVVDRGHEPRPLKFYPLLAWKDLAVWACVVGVEIEDPRRPGGPDGWPKPPASSAANDALWFARGYAEACAAQKKLATRDEVEAAGKTLGLSASALRDAHKALPDTLVDRRRVGAHAKHAGKGDT